MKKILFGLAILVVLLGAAIVVVPSLVPEEVYREQLAAKISAATGREFRIAGEVKLSVFPSVHARIGGATLSNQPGGRAEPMAELGEADVGLALFPLLSRRVEVTSFVLKNATIHLEVDKSGKQNWVFETAGATAEGTPQSGGGGSALSDISLGDVRLENGHVTYTNFQTGGETLDLQNINATVSLPSLDKPFNLKGDAVYKAEAIRLDVALENPRATIEGGTTALTTEIKGTHLDASFDGNATFGNTLQLAGATKLASPSVRKLAAWLGNPIQGSEQGFGPFQVSGQMDFGDDKFSFSNAELSFDKINATGNLSGNLAGDIPQINATLASDELDLRPYTTDAQAKQGSGEKAPAQAAEWSSDPIDASALKAFNADMHFTAKKMFVQNLSIEESDLNISVRGGVLTADLRGLTLYQGKATGNLVLDARQARNQVSSKLTLTNVVLERFLKDFANSDRFEGLGSFNIDVRGAGVSQKDIVSSLAGTAAINFSNGAIRGVDLGKVAQIVGNLAGKEEQPAAPAEGTTGSTEAAEATETAQGEGEKTTFVSLGSNFQIANGVLNTGDFKMISDLISLSGSGSINLPQQTINFSLLPGQNQNDGGLKVGLLVTGPLAKPKFAPDPRALIRNEVGKALGGTPAGQILEGILGGGQQPAGQTGEGQQAAPPPAQQLFEGLFGGKKKESEAPPTSQGE